MIPTAPSLSDDVVTCVISLSVKLPVDRFRRTNDRVAGLRNVCPGNEGTFVQLGSLVSGVDKGRRYFSPVINSDRYRGETEASLGSRGSFRSTVLELSNA